LTIPSAYRPRERHLRIYTETTAECNAISCSNLWPQRSPQHTAACFSAATATTGLPHAMRQIRLISIFNHRRITARAGSENQPRHYHRRCHSPTITATGILIDPCRWQRHLRLNLILASRACFTRPLESQTQGEVLMSGQVILYFEDQSDALRFALAAGSVMAGDGNRATNDLVQETTRVTRIRLDAANKGKIRQPNPPERVA
jgi:hypothetical protein